MHSIAVRNAARSRVAAGERARDVAEDLGVAQATVSRWVNKAFVSDDAAPRCRACEGASLPPPSVAAYGYLLGQYLGDGHLVTRARVPVLRVYCCSDYPLIADRVRSAIMQVRGREPAALRSVHTERMMTVQSYWMHWPCLLPQHGPGRKHERPIRLTAWQQQVIDADPWPLIRGLIDSDGCRALNRVVVRGKAYSYPRYFFGNESRDILQIAGAALDAVGVQWRFNRPNSISIARRPSVALMDAHVGPKQ